MVKTGTVVKLDRVPQVLGALRYLDQNRVMVGIPSEKAPREDSPINNAAISLATPANSVYRKNFVFAKECVTMVTADLEIPPANVKAARDQYDGVSMRSLVTYVPGTDQTVARTDVLFGFLYLKPEWGVIVTDRR